MLYFAYGSNMSTRRIRQRVPSAQPLSVGVLDGHRLAFHKVGRDGSAKCDALVSPNVGECLYGVVYRIDPAHRARLDAAEGLGNGYQCKTVALRLADGTRATAFTYYATHIDPSLRPYPWYKEHVLRGAREHGLPGPHIAEIAGIPTVDDHDPARQVLESAVYGPAEPSRRGAERE